MEPELMTALAAAGRSEPLSAAGAAALLPLLRSHLVDLMAVARVAASCGGVDVFTCGIVNAKSGLCQENCAFCAQSRHHAAGVAAHPLLAGDEALFRAERFADAGVDRMGIVTSGGGPDPDDFEKLCRMAGRIRRNVDIKLCASLGLVDFRQAEELRRAGFTSYHHNLETSRSHYPAICVSHGYEARARTIRNAKMAGLRVCAGGIFGVGETWEQRLELSGELANLGVDSIPLNFLVPIPGTPLADAAAPGPETALAVIALFRLMHPRRDLVVCGGRELSLGRFGALIFSAGANGVMVGDYLTVKGVGIDEDRLLLETLGLRHG